MAEPQPTTSPTPITPPSSSGVFGTKIPSTVTFAVGILLFFTPFLEIKCNSMTFMSVSGVQLATGFSKDKNSNQGYFPDNNSSEGHSTVSESDKEGPNIYAILALVFAILGLILGFVKMRQRLNSITGIIMALGTTICLILLWSDIGNRIRMESPNNNNMGFSFSIGMTSWFYVTVVVFLAAAFFSFKRLQAESTNLAQKPT